MLREQFSEMRGFMKVSQIKELLEIPFCYLALHGCCHLDLSKTKSLIDKAILFKNDLDSGITRLNELGLQTNTYVYPYVHSFPLSDKILSTLQNPILKLVIGSKVFRIAIENLALQHSNCCNS